MKSEILSLINSHPGIEIFGIVNETGLPFAEATGFLSDLLNDGRIHFKDTKRKKGYIFTGKQYYYILSPVKQIDLFT
jgi:predicted transcriptional regulator